MSLQQQQEAMQITSRVYLLLGLLYLFWTWTSFKSPVLEGAAAAAPASAPVRAARSDAHVDTWESETLPAPQRHASPTSFGSGSSLWVLFDAGRETTKAGVRAVRSSAEPERESFSAGVVSAPRANSGHSNGHLSSKEKGRQPAAVLTQQKVHTEEGAPAPAPPTSANAAASTAAADALQSAGERPALQPATTRESGRLYTIQAQDSVHAQPSPKVTAGPLKSFPRQQHQRALRESGPLAGVFRAFQQLAAAAASAAGKREAASGDSSSTLQEGFAPPAQQQLWEKQQHEKQRQHSSEASPSASKRQEEVPVQNRQTQYLQKQLPQRLLPHPYRLAPRIKEWLLQGVHMRRGAGATAASGEKVPEALLRTQVETGSSSERLKETDLDRNVRAALEAEFHQRHLFQSHHQPTKVQPQPRHHQQELAAACTWGTAGAWLVHMCLPFGSPVSAVARDANLTSAASPADAAGDDGVTGKCHCLSARPQTLLREVLTIEPQQKANQQQHPQLEQLQPLGPQLVTVLLGHRHSLLCCTHGFTMQEDSQRLQAERLPASVFVSNDTGDAGRSAVSAAAVAASDAGSAAAAHEQPAGAGMPCCLPSPLQDFRRAVFQESSQAGEGPAVATHRVSRATHAVAAAATARFAESAKVVSADEIFSESGQHSSADTARSVAATPLTASFSMQPQNQKEQQQWQQLQDSDGEPLGKAFGDAQETQHPLQQQHRQLSSQWRGHFVFWTWRRSCMRQQQPRPAHGPVTAAAAAAAAAVCYRQHTTKSLALQLLLLLLPHDLAVRLITKRDPAQCQQQPPLQPQQEQEQQPCECVTLETPKSHALPLAAGDATCRVPALKLGKSSGRDTGTCAAAHQKGTTHETVIRHADELQQTANEHGYDKPCKVEPIPLSDDEQLEKQKNRDDGKQQQGEQHQPAVDATLNEFDGQQDKREQQQRQQPQQVDQVQPKAASAIGGYPGAPQLYGREFVRGTQLTSSFLRLHFNFASLDAGARIVASSPGMQHVKAVQRPDGDTYMLVPCSVPTKYFVLSFAETLKIEFVAFHADTYPSRQWRLVANVQTAADVASELFSVFGATAVQVLETHLQDELGGDSPGLGADADEGAAAADALAAAATAAVAVRAGGDSEETTGENDSALRTVEASAEQRHQPHSGLQVKEKKDEAYTQQVEQQHKYEQLAASGIHPKQAQQHRHTSLPITTSKAQQEAGSGGDTRRSNHSETASDFFLAGEARRKGDGAAAALGDTSCSGQQADATLREAAGAADSKLTGAAQQQQQQLLLLLEKRPTFADAEQQTATAVSALSAALEEAVQQQQSLFLHRRQQFDEQELAALRAKAVASDTLWVPIPEAVMSATDVHSASTRQDQASCMSSSSNATTRWQRYQPLLQPTTRRYICAQAVSAAPIYLGVAPKADAHQETDHLVALDSRSSGGSSTKTLPAEAASEALQQASAYARAFLLEVLKHQRPQQHHQQERQRPIGSAFLTFLMTASLDAPQHRAEILRVLSLLLQPPTVETTSAAVAAAEEEDMLQQASRRSPEAGDAFCRSVDDGNSNQGNSTQQQQHHHCRVPPGLPTWLGFWDSLQQMMQPLHLLWGGTVWLVRHVGGEAVALAGILGHLLQQLICKDAELALLQQSCAAALGVTRVVGFAAGIVASAATAIAEFTCGGFSFATAAAAAMWTRLLAFTLSRSSEPYSAVEFSTTSSQSSNNLSWGQRLLLAQDRASAQSAEVFAASPLLLLLVLFLLFGAMVLWRLRHGQRVAAAAAGECALLRRSFELLQQQHRLLQQQLLQFEREQELLLLLTANHQSSRSSRLLLQRSKSIGFVADGSSQKHQPQRPHAVPLDIKKTPQKGSAEAASHPGKPTSTLARDEACGGRHAAEGEPASAKAATPASSLLRRLSSTFAPRMLLGLSRQADANPANSAASCSNDSVDSGARKTSSIAHSPFATGSTEQDKGAQMSPRSRLVRAEDSEGQQLLLLQEQQQAEQQHLQLAAATLLPALDTKAIRGLKLQRHTVRQRRVGGAATPVASPAAAAADGHCPALSPAGTREAAALACDSRVVAAAARDATAAAAKAAPSCTSSSRSSSVYSASGHTDSIHKAFIKSHVSSTPLPSISLLLQSAQQRAGLRAGPSHRTGRNGVDRSYSSSGSCSSSSGSFLQPATRAATAAVPLRWHRDEYPPIPDTSRAAAGGVAAGSGSYIDCCSSSAADGSNVSGTASHRSLSSSSSRRSGGGIREALPSRPLHCGAFEGQRVNFGEDCSRIQSAWPDAAVPSLRSLPGPRSAADLSTRSAAWVAAGFGSQRSFDQKSTLSTFGHAGGGNVRATADSTAAKATPMNKQEHQQQQVVQARRDGRRRRKKRGAS
ncbi:hypothetical protein Emag_006623 [Eimeria magna]